MEFRRLGGPEDAVHLDDVVQSRIRLLKDRLAEQLRTTALLQCAPAGEIPLSWTRRAASAGDGCAVGRSEVRWNSAGHYIEVEVERSAMVMQRLHILLGARRYDEFSVELARAEIAGEIPEFYVLNFQAILAVNEGSGFADDYFEMARAVAASPHELAILAENLARYDLLRGEPLAAAERCVDTLADVCQTEGLWTSLLLALHRLGDTGMVDAVLHGVDRLNHACIGRLVRSFSSEPELGEVREWPAFRHLRDRVTAEPEPVAPLQRCM